MYSVSYFNTIINYCILTFRYSSPFPNPFFLLKTSVDFVVEPWHKHLPIIQNEFSVFLCRYLEIIWPTVHVWNAPFTILSLNVKPNPLNPCPKLCFHIRKKKQSNKQMWYHHSDGVLEKYIYINNYWESNFNIRQLNSNSKVLEVV